MRRILSLFLSLVLLTGLFSSCLTAEPKPSGDKPLVVATNFAVFDIARQVAGDSAEVGMLLPPETESHGYEVTLAVWEGNDPATNFYKKMGMKPKETTMEYIL